MEMYKKSYFWPLVALCVVSLFLFLGQTFFNTRGEPREAVVALSMLQQGNWVLPVNNGVELAFKPPFFHWCIAAISTVAGAVNEYTSRMPSALALSAMVLVGYVFYAKRRGAEVAFIAALLTLTNFEVHRAGVACRVDMVLTAMMVIALYQLYKWGEKDLKGVPWVAVLCLSAAALTKGPVGIVLPCLVPAVFLWIRGRKFLRIFFSFLMVAVLACVLPAVWYWAAYQQGGDHFLDLVLEENVYRFLGKMTYASHENPAWYNVMTVVAGYAPYTLLGLVSLFFLRYRKPQGRVRTWWSRFVAYIRNMDDARLYSLLCIVIIFTFYCIPKSKRSVYLLPIYPFIAYFLAEYIIYLRHRHLNALRVFGSIMAALAVLLLLVFGAVRMGWVPGSLFAGRHAAENIAYMHALEDFPLTVFAVLGVLVPVAAACWYFRVQRRNAADNGIIYAFIAVIFSIFFALDGVYQPVILNVKSDRAVAEEVRRIVPEGRLYSFRTDVVEGNRMHPFTVNFYLGDRMVPFDCFTPPAEGYVFMGGEMAAPFLERYGEEFSLEEVYASNHRSCDDKRYNVLYRFSRKQAEP